METAMETALRCGEGGTLGHQVAQYHLIRLLPGTSLFVYLALDRASSNLATARHALKQVEPGIVAEVSV